MTYAKDIHLKNSKGGKRRKSHHPDKEPLSVLRLLIFRFGECNNRDIDTAFDQADFKYNTYKHQKDRLTRLQSLAMRHTVDKAIGIVYRIVNAIGAQRMKLATHDQRLNLFGDLFDEIPAFTARMIYPQEAKSVDFKSIFSHSDDLEICRKCAEWIQYRTIHIMDAAYTYYVSQAEEDRIRPAINREWRSMARYLHVRKTITPPLSVGELPCVVGGHYGGLERQTGGPVDNTPGLVWSERVVKHPRRFYSAS